MERSSTSIHAIYYTPKLELKTKDTFSKEEKKVVIEAIKRIIENKHILLEPEKLTGEINMKITIQGDGLNKCLVINGSNVFVFYEALPFLYTIYQVRRENFSDNQNPLTEIINIIANPNE